MKIITVSDLHGKDVWKTINPFDWDKIVFLGDYVDGAYKSVKQVSKIDSLYRVLIDPVQGVSNSEMIYNLSEIIQLKKKYPDKIELLWGNHDVQYLYLIKNNMLQSHMMCSGYRTAIQYDIANIFYDNRNLFKISYQYKNYLWSHAGITPIAYDVYFKKLINDNFDIMSDELNKYFILNYNEIFAIGYSRGGKNEVGSILWAHTSEWDISGTILPFIQIIGHNHVNNIEYKYSKLHTTPLVIFTDVLHSTTEFLKLDI